MYQIHGLSISSNTAKTLYVAEALGIDYEYIPLDIKKGEHKTPEHLARHPFGKLPTLTHDNERLFESDVICRYLAETENSDLYPANDLLIRTRINQWLSFFSAHLGRWLNTYAFERYAKITLGFGEPNKATEAEAYNFIQQQLPVVNQIFEQNEYLLGKTITITDYVTFAYFECTELADLSLRDYPATLRWFEKMKMSNAVKRAHGKLERG